MYDLVVEKWEEILNFFKNEYDIANVSFNSWIKPLQIHSVEKNMVTLLFKENDAMIEYIRKKFYLPLMVSIQEITGEDLDVEFVTPAEIDKRAKQSKEKETKEPAVPHNAAPASNKNLLINNKKIEANLNPNYTFENFVVGGNNNYAHAYALAVAESPAEMYNPLFIYGGVGLGKTHLMHSIGNFILDKAPDTKVRCVTSEIFTNELINAIRSENQSAIMEFRNKYRNIDILLIDDIQFVIGKERSQEEFFHTFNSLYEANKQIVISSDKPPKDMSTLEERLKSRFEMGLTVDVSAPDYETRMAILLRKADTEGYDIDNEILEYIANNIKSNIRELEGALTKIVAFSRVSKSPINLDFAKEVLKDIISPDANKEITAELIINTVAEHFNITSAEIISKIKSQDIVYPRQIAMYLCRYYTGASLKVVGLALGRKDHTTVMHAIEKIQHEIDTNETTRNTIEIIKKKIIPN